MEELISDILKNLNESTLKLTTRDVLSTIKDSHPGVTKSKVQSKLLRLWGQKYINGELVGISKPMWIWWKKLKKVKGRCTPSTSTT